MEEISQSVSSPRGTQNPEPEERLSVGQIFLFILRVAVGVIFIYAGISKALDPDGFMADIGRFQILPQFFLAPTAIYLPYLEILTGLTLITGLFYFGGLLLTKGMLVAFSAGLASAWARGLDITCGCFGKGFGDLPVEWALLRNGVLMAICLGLAVEVFRNRQFGSTPLPDSDQ